MFNKFFDQGVDANYHFTAIFFVNSICFVIVNMNERINKNKMK